MQRISTATTYQSALLNILNAQSRESVARNQVSSGKVANSLQGFGGTSDALVATRTLKARVDAQIENATILSSTLEVQNQAMEQVASTAVAARAEIANALANGTGQGLMTALEGFFGQAVDALNMEYQGRYLFAGGQLDTPPLAHLKLPDLTAAPTVASLFRNDQLVTTSRVTDRMIVETGFLADDLGADLFEAFKAAQDLHQTLGPLQGALTPAQKAGLEALLPAFDNAADKINARVADNGGVQSRLERVQDGLLDRQITLKGVLSDMTDVDMAEAVSRLQLATTALQASAQVFSTLSGSSLLNLMNRG